MAIKPELGGGFRDYLPADMIPRQKMFETIRQVFERFGYLPLDTPGVEREEILTGGDPSFKMQIFRLRLGEDEDLALRFDLTVPLARVVAAYPQDILKPFKRYQVGKVWRGEKPQAGRFREFVQFDADIVGSSSMMADAEIIALMYETMTALGFSNFLVRVNNRKVLNGLSAYAGYSETKNVAVLRSIDKLDRYGWETVSQELARKPDNEFDTESLNLSEDQISAIKKFLDIEGGNNEKLLSRVEELMANSPAALEGILELREIDGNVKALGIPDNKWRIDLSVARGLGYYTGPVFETVLTDFPSIGSVFSGGRYDDLVARFGTATVPATGASVGVDRIYAAMEQLKIVPREVSVAQVIILNFDASCHKLYQSMATDLRRAGISTDIYLGQENSLKGQLVYAVKQEVPVVIIAGSTEMSKGVVQVRDTKVRKQKEIPLSQLIEEVKKLLSK